MFEYKDLSKLSGLLKHDFLVMYAEALQDHALEMEREIARTREERSKDGNRFFQKEAKLDKSENRGLYKQIGQLEGRLAELEGRREGELQKQKGIYEGKLKEMEIRHKAEVEALEAQIKSLKDNQVIEVVTEESKVDYRMVDRVRDRKGRVLPTGSSKEDRKRMCYRLMELEGMSPEDVAAELGNISPASVKTYCSEYKKDRTRKLKELEARKKAEREYAAYLEQVEERTGLGIEHTPSRNLEYNNVVNLW